jgi:hypothetical protein
VVQPQLPAQGAVRGHDTPEALERYNREQLWEYQQWIAADNIHTPGGTLAFPQGYPVPVSTVERLGWDKDGTVVRPPYYEEVKAIHEDAPAPPPVTPATPVVNVEPEPAEDGESE